MLKLGIKPRAGRALALSLAVSAALAAPGLAWAGDGGPALAPPQAAGAGAAPAGAGPVPALATPGVATVATVATPATPGATTVVVPAVAPAGAASENGPPAPAESAPFSLAALAPERLERMRGGADAVWNDMKLSGAVSGNTAVNVATGSNIITNGSFGGASGLPIAIQNSGANVLIQNATIVNVQLR
ncbi:hypothetical protein [Rugamonas sp. DEMB1]|uniref:hypothetical protein n=1 Tax=Rugamonas sp. DEMB1 TaxID=3039386 RepID=UPI00244BF785|nr:hypothetical protein [Rugamonas sp. DEMB1]WGG52490.1 hypothetical protein QC826_10290 [Rugamonas sp. DEMB1]